MKTLILDGNHNPTDYAKKTHVLEIWGKSKQSPPHKTTERHSNIILLKTSYKEENLKRCQRKDTLCL